MRPAFAAIGSKLIAVPLAVVSRALGTNDRAMFDTIERVANGPLAVVIAMALWAGVWEELVFRGFILSRARVACGGWFATPARADMAAVALQAGVFGLVHVWQSTDGQINAALTGLVLGYVAIRTRSIVPGMVGHAAIDLVALLVARSGALHH